jgi:hypothetical protein
MPDQHILTLRQADQLRTGASEYPVGSPDAFSLASAWWIFMPLLFIGIAVIIGDRGKQYWRNRLTPAVRRRNDQSVTGNTKARVKPE